MRPEWVIGVGDIDDQGGYHAFEYLWGGSRRPRGLILTDDVVARGAMTAIVGRKVRVPDDLQICVWCNRHSPIVFPESWMTWQFDVRQFSRQAVSYIRTLQAGKPVPHLVQVPGQYVEAERGGRKSPARQKRIARFRTADQILAQADR
jgi:DNA-binding LacI/PurR family transcriptional regulator